jgi:putative tryptophan/tyrosine transport system substrate-binding protein
MNRREFAFLLTAGMMAWPLSAFAQMSARRSLVAILVAGSSTNVSRNVLNGFLEGMQGLGYVEGRDIDFVYRYADNDPARMPALAMI